MSSEVWQLYNGILQNVVICSFQKGLKMPSLCLVALVCFLNEVFSFSFYSLSNEFEEFCDFSVLKSLMLIKAGFI